ncbi:acylphosphatase [Chitinophaga parva]|uniref:acylphosphatase n=1 Tax=Chitinophaga parva TaxID=2169414 RepID=A0A2T7BBX2_9BACT|nr:acylphosphatase [Chitinophaga parva]PUZ21873.1 acylphosphatase [Chitinophaga parva]
MEKIHKEVIVRGLVQGVSFRAYARREAAKLGITGTVKNQADGSVAIVAEGSPANMESFIAWSRKGPLMASVEQVEVSDGPVKGYDEFMIIR